uniref:Uncharacterized protein n=1 Tax=Methylophaga nitratireducenticrescens TaxID=754476 RepID=I1XJ00_METNJ
MRHETQQNPDTGVSARTTTGFDKQEIKTRQFELMACHTSGTSK